MPHADCYIAGMRAEWVSLPRVAVSRFPLLFITVGHELPAARRI